MQRKVNVVEDFEGNKIVVIHDIKFKGRQSIEWTDVEDYLKQYIGEAYVIESTNDMVYMGVDLPEEYAHSNYTIALKGANAKANANAAQGIPEIIEIAMNKSYKDNFKEKHNKDAKYGWYRYDSRFALPVFNEIGEVERYNVFCVIMVVRHREFVNKIIKTFEGTEYEKKTDNILRFIDKQEIKMPRTLYTSSLHEFGREDGRQFIRC